MKKCIITLAVFCLQFVIFNSSEIFAQGFNSITTPDGVNLVAVGNSGKMYRSINGGVVWSSHTHGVLNMNSVTSFGNDVWIAANKGSIYKTIKIPSPVNIYNTGTSNLNSITFVDASTGYVCGDNGVVYKSVDGGLNWALSNTGISSIKLNSISFKDAENGIVVGDDGAIYVSNDGGASWNSQTSPIIYNLIKVKYFSNELVAVGEYGTLLKNSGSGWTIISSRTKTDIRGVTGTGINDVHICGGGGFIRNNKNGSSNFFNFERNPMMANLVDIFYYDNNKGWAVSSLNSVIIYSTNGGSSWSMPSGANVYYGWVSKLNSSSGFGNNLCEHPFNRDALFVVYGSTVYRSGNRGETWTNIASVSGGGRAHSFYVSPLDSNIWVVAIDNPSAVDKVKRTTNYGANWTDIVSANFSSSAQPLEMDQNNPSNYYFAPVGGGFYRSTDNAASFQEISGNYPFRSPRDIIVMWDSSNVIFVGDGVTTSGQGKIYKSINGGINWTEVYTVVSSLTPSLCNSVFERNVIYSTEWNGINFYKSTNFGNNWALTGSTGQSGWGSDICHEDPTLVLKGTYGSPTWLSTNSGLSFTSTTIAGGGGAGIIVPDRGYLIAMQALGLFKMYMEYTDNPILINIDVQTTSIGATGVNYYPKATINPIGTVKNNNGAANATFNVTRRITPGSYVSTKTINLAASSSTDVIFDPWTFNSGTAYIIKDSVYILDDVNTSNDVLTGTITPYFGDYVNILTQQFTGIFPPSGWTIGGTAGPNHWFYSTYSSYGNGTGSATYNFFDSPAGNNQTMTSPTFTTSISGDKLIFDYAYAPNISGIDSLLIQISTNGGSTYTNLTKLYGKAGYTGDSTLNTAPATGVEFFPASNNWLTKTYSLPMGTNRVRFRARSGLGNNLYIDNININTGNVYTQVNLTLAFEGFFDGTIQNMPDTVTAYLRNIIPPFATVDSAKAILNASLTAACVFKAAPSGTYYYRVIHRNALETWSDAGGESFTKGVTSAFDFTSSQAQSYGSNAVLKLGKWCFYSGDVNMDGAINPSDLSAISNDAYNFISGYVVTDLNGDGTTDISDAAIADNNAANFVSKITPETSPNDVQRVKDVVARKIE